MSLLMQALRKAESAKKKQDAVTDTPEPVTGELTLESKEPTREDIATANEVAAEAAAHGLVADRDEPAPAPAPPAPQVDYFSSEVPPARTLYVPPEALPEPAAQGFDPDRGFTATPAAAAPPPEPPPQPIPEVAPARTRVGMEQQKEADHAAARKALEARNAASAVFAAKLRSRNRRPMVIAAVGVLLLSMAAAYGYFQFMGVNQPALATIPAGPEPAVLAAPEAVVTPPVVAVAAPVVAALVPAPGATVSAPAPVIAAAPVRAPRAARVAVVRVSEGATVGRAVPLPAAAPRQPAPARDAAPIEFRRNDASRQLNPTLGSAYQSFVGGDLVNARSQYQRVLQQEPDNRDAMLGMAAIALNKGQSAEAGSFYTRLLELDPTDAEAATGLASVQRGDPNQTESSLKKVLAANPQTGSAHFALGNVYAQQQRWAEAQQAYFQALGAAPGNADYAFNLAVSLDKLGQKKLALDNYQRALQLAQRAPANVSQPVVKDRIRQLQQEITSTPPR